MIEVRRASSRFRTDGPGRTTWHSFSFGEHYDPANLGFAGLVCHNDDHVVPGSGYADHPHADLEIVTWVLDGALTHRDSAGHLTTVGAGEVQVLSAGSGIRHSETVDPRSGPTRFVQAWVRPDAPGTEPSYVKEDAEVGSSWTTVVGPGGLPIGTTGASLALAHLDASESLVVPAQTRGHLFVARGAVALGLEALTEADAARLSDADPLPLTCLEPADLMLWSFGKG